MEKNQAITLALGAGALGTALAFFGYNYMNQQTVVSSAQDDDSLYNEVEREGDEEVKEDEGQEMKKIKKEVEEGVKGAVDKKTAWAAFWGKEYTKDKKKEEVEEEDQSAE